MGARVFISCGQNRHTDEAEIAEAIAGRLKGLGFEPYVAVQEQTLVGLTENIFARLSESEYFVFVDFKREQIANLPTHRGSLFSHQELAIAAFLKLEVIALQENGVLALDGVIKFLQANADTFEDRDKVPALVESMAVAKGWKPDWRRGLLISRDPGEYSDADVVDPAGLNHGRKRFFHATVRNQHRSLASVHTIVYLDSVTPVASATPLALKVVEAKWAGYAYPSAVVRPHGERSFDCCVVDMQAPHVALVNAHVDSSEYAPIIRGPGEFVLRFTAIDDRVPSASVDLLLKLGKTIEEATLREMALSEIRPGY